MTLLKDLQDDLAISDFAARVEKKVRDIEQKELCQDHFDHVETPDIFSDNRVPIVVKPGHERYGDE